MSGVLDPDQVQRLHALLLQLQREKLERAQGQTVAAPTAVGIAPLINYSVNGNASVMLAPPAAPAAPAAPATRAAVPTAAKSSKKAAASRAAASASSEAQEKAAAPWSTEETREVLLIVRQLERMEKGEDWDDNILPREIASDVGGGLAQHIAVARVLAYKRDIPADQLPRNENAIKGRIQRCKTALKEWYEFAKKNSGASADDVSTPHDEILSLTNDVFGTSLKLEVFSTVAEDAGLEEEEEASGEPAGSVGTASAKASASGSASDPGGASAAASLGSSSKSISSGAPLSGRKSTLPPGAAGTPSEGKSSRRERARNAEAAAKDARFDRLIDQFSDMRSMLGNFLSTFSAMGSGAASGGAGGGAGSWGYGARTAGKKRRAGARNDSEEEDDEDDGEEDGEDEEDVDDSAFCRKKGKSSGARGSGAGRRY